MILAIDVGNTHIVYGMIEAGEIRNIVRVHTDPRSTVQYLVTEYGMVNLKGMNTWQRAEKIISIAHPDFREDLIRQAEKMHIWRRTSRR